MSRTGPTSPNQVVHQLRALIPLNFATRPRIQKSGQQRPGDLGRRARHPQPPLRALGELVTCRISMDFCPPHSLHSGLKANTNSSSFLLPMVGHLSWTPSANPAVNSVHLSGCRPLRLLLPRHELAQTNLITRAARQGALRRRRVNQRRRSFCSHHRRRLLPPICWMNDSFRANRPSDPGQLLSSACRPSPSASQVCDH